MLACAEYYNHHLVSYPCARLSIVQRYEPCEHSSVELMLATRKNSAVVQWHHMIGEDKNYLRRYVTQIN